MGRRRALRESAPLSSRRDDGKHENIGSSEMLSDGNEEILSDTAFDGSDDEVVYGDVLRTIGRRNKEKEEVEQLGQQLFREEEEESGDNNSFYEGNSSASSSDEGDDDGRGGLIDFVDGLVSARTCTARSEGIDNYLQTLPETEFALPPSRETLAATSNDGGVSLEALIAPLQDQTTFAAVSGKVKDLNASQKIKPPSEPLIARRAERAVAYESARTEVTRWVPAVQKERQEEVSDFRPKIDHLVSKPTTGALVDKFVPRPGTVEKRVADLLSEIGSGDNNQENSRLTANATATVDEGLTRSYDPEEVKRKLARLKSTRALLFYHERKRHQINKIKSKLYRKIRRKQRKKRQGHEEEGNDEAQDSEGNGDQEEEDQAIARARERATLRHSAMKLLKGHKGLGSIRSRDISESARLAKELQQKIQDTSEDEDSSLDDDAGRSDEDGYRDQKTLEAIGTDQDSDTRNAALVATGKGGLMSMEFMKRGIIKQQEMVKLERDKALNELYSLENEEQQHINNSNNGEGINKKAIHNPVLDALDPIVMNYSSPSGPASSTSGNVVVIGSTNSHSHGSKDMKEEDGNNPWLGIKKVERCVDDKVKKRNKKAASGESKNVTVDPIDAALGALPDHQSSFSNLELVNNINRIATTSNVNGGLIKGGSDSISMKQSIKKRKAGVSSAGTSHQDKEVVAKGGEINVSDEISHEKLVRHAFATPDLEQAFRDMKANEVERETEDELGKMSKRNGNKSFTTEAPGWGSWTGLGAPVSRKPHSLILAEDAKKKALIQAKKKRKDALLPTVMLNNKRQKRSALLRVAQVPYPFTSREQYERSMRRPIGPEWNTCQSVRALTKKPELTRAGAIIAPLSTKVKEG